MVQNVEMSTTSKPHIKTTAAVVLPLQFRCVRAGNQQLCGAIVATGTTPHAATSVLVVPICAKRFHRYYEYSGQRALPNRR